MYRLVLNGKPVGDFEKVVFTKASPTSGSFISCDREEADGVVAGGQVYALTDADAYKNYDQVALFELDGDVETSAKLDYMKVMYGNV